jgi:hypothetical protein
MTSKYACIDYCRQSTLKGLEKGPFLLPPYQFETAMLADILVFGSRGCNKKIFATPFNTYTCNTFLS